MDHKDWITVTGWVVALLVAIVSGGIIVPKLTKKRKILAWAVISETELIPRELAESLGVPVIIQVGDHRPSSLTTVTIRLGGAGDEVIENLDVAVTFNQQANILNIRPARELGEYAKYAKWTSKQDRCQVEADFLNPKDDIELEFLLSDYEPGSVDVDAAAAGLIVRRSDPLRWDLATSIPGMTSMLSKVSFRILGVGYEPTAAPMNEIAEELKAIRRMMRKS